MLVTKMIQRLQRLMLKNTSFFYKLIQLFKIYGEFSNVAGRTPLARSLCAAFETRRSSFLYFFQRYQRQLDRASSSKLVLLAARCHAHQAEQKFARRVASISISEHAKSPYSVSDPRTDWPFPLRQRTKWRESELKFAWPYPILESV